MAELGVDISTFQSGIDYDEAAKHIKFAIIRVGYGVSYLPDQQRDEEFDNHYNGFKGKIPLGAYYYAYGTSYDTGVKEAENCLAYMGDKTFEMPIYYDMEEGRNTAEAGQGFVDRIRQAGLKAGIYASSSFYYDKGLGSIDCDSIWIAQYGINDGNIPSDMPSISLNIWQYTSRGYVEGMGGNIDMDLLYSDTPSPEPTPTPPSPTPGFDPVILDYQQSWNKTYGDKYGYIAEDGLYGPETQWSKSKVFLKEGMNNHLVGFCQCRLKYYKGYDLGTSGVNHDGVDDDFGSKTEEAVIEFQRDNDLYPDGIIGYDTITLLLP